MGLTDIKQLLPQNIYAGLKAAASPSAANPFITVSALSAGYVPYTGATANVNLGVFSLTATGITNSSLTDGRVVYASTGGLLSDSANLLWINATARLQIGAGGVSIPFSLNIIGSVAGNYVGQSIQNGDATGGTTTFYTESPTRFAALIRFSSAYGGNFPGTSVPYASTLMFDSVTTGVDATGPILMNTSRFYSVPGTATTGVGFVNDSVGFRVDQNQNLHTTNLNPFTVNGKSFLGGNATASAYLHLAAGTATAATAPLKLTSGTNLTTAEPGAFEYDGTNFFVTRTGTTREDLLSGIQSSLNVLGLTALTQLINQIKVNIGGNDYYIPCSTANTPLT